MSVVSLKVSVKPRLVSLQQSGRTGKLPKATLLKTRRVCAQLKAAHNDDSIQQSEKILRAQSSTPRPNGWSSDFTKNLSSFAAQGSPVQSHIVTGLYYMLRDPLLGHASVQKKRAAFMQQLRLADKANVFAVWPFPENNGECSQLVFQHNLSELIQEAFHAKSLPKVLPLVHILMQALPPCSTKHSPQLLQFLDRLATLRKARETSFALRDQLDQVLQPWMLPLQQVMADEEVRFKTSALQSNAAVGQSQLQANTSPASDNAAMQPLSMRTPHVEETAFFPQLRPYLWAPPAEQMQILRGDDLSPTALDAYELVKTFVPPVIPEVLQPTEIWCQHRDLLGKIGGGKHGPAAIRSYLRSHDKVYKFDYNAVMSQRRRLAKTQDKEHGQAVPPLNPDHILSVGADVGLADVISQDNGTNHVESEDYYL